jgi:hypothetical protein
METNLIKKTKWFWVWDDEKEEVWLSEMSREGLHLETVTFPGMYRFRRGEPQNYVYRLDYQSLRSKDKESYLQLFEDAGWEQVGEMNGWVYFRILASEGKEPEIYSDAESKMKKYQRILTYLVIFLPMMLILFPEVSDRDGLFFTIIESLFALLLLLYAYSIFKLFTRIEQIKKTAK